MADEFQIGSGNWWDSSRNRFDSASSPPSSSALSSVSSFGWATEIGDLKARSSMDSVSVSGSSMVFQDTQKLPGPDSAGGVLAEANLQMMGLGLSAQAMDWNPTLLRGGGKADSGYRSVLEEDLRSSANFQQETGMGSSSQDQWRQKIYSGSSDDSSTAAANEYKQISRGFSLDQPQFNSHIISSGGGGGDSVVTSFQMDHPAAYGNPSTILHGVLGSDSHQQQQQQQQSDFENRQVNYSYPPSYGMNPDELLPTSWSKYPQFLRASPPKQQQPHSQLQFSNNTTFWNATAAAMNDVRPSFFPSLQPQFPPPTFDEKPPKNTSEARDSSTVVKKSTSSETSNKRPRSETQSPLPAFKVRKEKMGDRITALQQLVSPFGKTDTASVLSEAIEYIKFLHEQINVLSTPYMKSGANSMQHQLQHQHQKKSDKSKDPEGLKQDLRSRGLCLVPASSTYPVTHETTVDFWNPTFGGTFR